MLHVAKASAGPLLGAVAAVLAPRGAFFFVTPVGPHTVETVRPIAGLIDEAGREIEAP